MSKNKILFLTDELDASDEKLEKEVKQMPDELKQIFLNNKVKVASLEDFKKGKREDKYDFVFCFGSSSDLEDNVDFYKYYGAAPVLVWVCDYEEANKKI